MGGTVARPGGARGDVRRGGVGGAEQFDELAGGGPQRLLAAVDGHVLVYVHKEQELHDVERRYPAERYVLVDDKLRILSAVKHAWGERVTTVFPRQGHYATDPAILAAHPPADVSVDRIGDLLELDLESLLGSR